MTNYRLSVVHLPTVTKYCERSSMNPQIQHKVINCYMGFEQKTTSHFIHLKDVA
jgi:hypothetical protein